MHFDKIIHTLLGNPARLLIVTVTESLLTFSGIIAGVVVGGELGVFGFINFDPSGLDVFF
jgi:hypothetical protein